METVKAWGSIVALGDANGVSDGNVAVDAVGDASVVADGAGEGVTVADGAAEALLAAAMAICAPVADGNAEPLAPPVPATLPMIARIRIAETTAATPAVI